jgi:exopolyphosphatase / guanosine-5'-triphosphate,3'-diphosphate pyrophosphatase
MEIRDLPPETRFAAIDVGSNSIKLRIAARSPGAGTRRWSVLHDEVVVTGLGRGLSVNVDLDPGAAATTLGVLRRFAGTIAVHGCAGVAAVGTQCLREARDGAAFAVTVGDDTGIPLEIITGREEARLAYLGACSELPADAADASLAVLDVGGRSTELGFGRRDHLERSASLAVGVLGVTERFLRHDPVTVAEATAAQVEIAGNYAVLPDCPEETVLIGIGATPATLGAVERGERKSDSTAIHGHRLSRAEIARQIELYRRLAVAERRQLPGLAPERAGVILAGALLVAAAMDRLGCCDLIVSVHGLRQGLLEDRFGGAAK